MRTWHLVYAVFMMALAFAVARQPVGRVALVVFVAMGAEIACGLTAVMLLFQTVGSIGEARGALEYVQCLMATAVVLVVGAGLMLAILSASLAAIGLVL